MPITLSEIAKRCKVSKQAVSQVLRNPEHRRFSPETRHKILAEAKKYHYIPNKLAHGLRFGKTNTVGLILAWNQTQMMDQADKLAKENGYSLLVQFTATPDVEREKKIFSDFLERRVDGIIWLPSCNDLQAQALFKEVYSNFDIPITVLTDKVDSLCSYRTVHWVWSDEFLAIRKGLIHLIEQGYKKVVFITHDRQNSDIGTSHRIESFKKAIQEFNLLSDLIFVPENQSAKESIKEYFNKTLEVPTALLSDGDYLAIDSMQAAISCGLRIPHDLGIITQGDLLFGGRYRLPELVCPSLTALRQPFDLIIERAFKILVSSIKEKNSENHTEPRREMVPSELIIRQSTLRRDEQRFREKQN